MFLIFAQLTFLLIGLMQSTMRRNNFLYIAASFGAFGTYVFVTGLRWRTGTDWLPYEESFTVLSNSPLESLGGTFEPGYAFLMAAVSKTFGSFSVFLVMQSAAIAVLLYRSAKIAKVSPVLFLACMILIQSQFWYPVRQQIAISACVYAMCNLLFVPGVNYARVYVPVILAGLLHSSALISLPILTAMLRVRKVYFFVLFLVAALILYLSASQLIMGFFEARLISYIYESDYGFDSSRNMYRLVERALTVALVLYLLAQKELFWFPPRAARGLKVVVLVGFGISVVALLAFPYLARLGSYFNWAEAAVIAATIVALDKASFIVRLVVCSLLVVLMLKFVGSLASYWELLDPYFFIFESVDRSVY